MLLSPWDDPPSASTFLVVEGTIARFGNVRTAVYDFVPCSDPLPNGSSRFSLPVLGRPCHDDFPNPAADALESLRFGCCRLSPSLDGLLLGPCHECLPRLSVDPLETVDDDLCGCLPVLLWRRGPCHECLPRPSALPLDTVDDALCGCLPVLL